MQEFHQRRKFSVSFGEVLAHKHISSVSSSCRTCRLRSAASTDRAKPLPTTLLAVMAGMGWLVSLLRTAYCSVSDKLRAWWFQESYIDQVREAEMSKLFGHWWTFN